MLKEAISLPGLAFKFKMSFLMEQGLHLSSFHAEDLYQLFKDNMVGGPAIIICETQYGQATCAKSHRLRPQCHVLVGLESTPASSPPGPPAVSSPVVWWTSGWPGWVAVSPTFAHTSLKGRSILDSANYRWMAMMLAARPSMSFTAVTGMVIDVG